MFERETIPPARPAPNWKLAVGLVVALWIAAGALYFYEFHTSRLIKTADIAEIPGDPGVQAFYLPDEYQVPEESFEQILQLQDKFVPMSVDSLHDVVAIEPRQSRWYRLEISNPDQTKVIGVLDMIWRSYDRMTFYDMEPNGAWSMKIQGGRAPNDHEAYSPDRRSYFIALQPGETRSVYVRVQDNFRLPSQFRFWFDYRDFTRQKHVEVARKYSYLFLWLGMAAYGIFLYAMIREKAQFHYALFLILFGGVFLLNYGFTANFVTWPEWPLGEILVSITALLALLNLCIFARHFLDTPSLDSVAERWIRRVQRLIWASMLTPVALLVPQLGLFFLQFILGLAAIVVGTLLWASIRSWHRGCRHAAFFILAFMPYFMGLISLTIFAQDKVVPHGQHRLAALIGNGLSLVMLSFATAYRHRVALDDIHRLQTNYMTNLENDVRERTRELRELSTQLSKAVTDRDRILAIIGHDLRGPAISLKNLTYLLTKDSDELSENEMRELTIEIEGLCTYQLELLNNLLIWGSAQSGTSKMQPKRFQLHQEAESVCTMLDDFAQSKQLNFHNRIPENLEIVADLQLFQTILRNFLTNAIKYSHPGNQIELGTCIQDPGWVDISVTDHGVGMSPERRDKLFQAGVESNPGTLEELGAGLGLSLCRDLAEAAGGSLWIESRPGQGTTAFLRMPLSGARPMPELEISPVSGSRSPEPTST